jgi:antitoxin component of MazEF toxin-antitoxin module
MMFNFGQRKIQKVRYTYMLPIPTDWIRNMKLEKSDILYIEMLSDQSLRITPVPQARQDSEGTGSATPINCKKRCSHGNYDIKR